MGGSRVETNACGGALAPPWAYGEHMKEQKVYDKRAQCTGKERFDSHERAQVVCESMRRRHTQRAPQVYRCVYCGGYHIGGRIKR